MKKDLKYFIIGMVVGAVLLGVELTLCILIFGG